MNQGSLKVTTPTDREIRMTRRFDAPRNLVYDAYTRPELVKRWLGVFRAWTMKVCEIDLRVGGTYRFVWHNADDGSEMGMGGVYREVVPNARLINTECFDQPWYEGEAVGTAEFVEQDGKTTLTTTVRYASKEIRDMVLQSPMEQGVAASYDKLADVLAETPGVAR